MNVCFLLHFHQPSNQFSDVIKKIAQECYVPLIKSIKNDRRVKITANFSLSLLEQLDRYGYGWLIRDVKELITAGRIELVGSAAYHPLLTKIPQHLAIKQVILNEMAYGYYFGSTKDFEGEDCFMIKDVKGFFPPEMAVNKELLNAIFTLGYEWVAVDEFCLPREVRERRKSEVCYTIDNQTPKLVVRDRKLTNLISFKRDLDRTQIVEEILSGGGDKVIALDAETFGHHFKDGVYLFESIVSEIYNKGLETSTISNVVCGCECQTVSSAQESTWSSEVGSIYPLWENADSEINIKLWLLFRELHAEYSRRYPSDSDVTAENGLSCCRPIWSCGYAEKGSSIDERTRAELSLLKLEQSDQFWWSAGVEIMGKKNFSRYMIESVLDYYKQVVSVLELDGAYLDKLSEIAKLLEHTKV